MVTTKPASAPQGEAEHAAWLLRLLLGPSVGVIDGAWIDWDLLLGLARANGVLVRTAERLATLGMWAPDGFALAVARERERIGSTLDLMRRVSRACDARGIEFLFPKAFQDYPDFGDDIDLLLQGSEDLDAAIVAGMSTSVDRRDLGEWLAGAVTYRVVGCPSPLDVQHGRLGLVGEHTAFPRLLMRHRRRIVVEGAEFFVPRIEDQLVLQGLQRIVGRLRIPLSDVVFTASTVRGGALDWDYVIATARQHEATLGLGCYLSYVEQIYRDVLWQPLFPESVGRRFGLSGWGRVTFRKGAYRFPLVPVSSRLYVRQLGSRIGAGDWAGAGRLFLTPLVAGVRLVHRLTRLTSAATGRQGQSRQERIAAWDANA